MDLNPLVLVPETYLLDEIFHPIGLGLPAWAQALTEQLSEEIVNQPLAVERAVRTLVAQHAGISDPRRPPPPLFFVGPSGSGKTFTAEDVARLWLGPQELTSESVGPLIKISGPDMQEKHEGARWGGAPPGYIGYKDKTPVQGIGVFDKAMRMRDVEERIRQWMQHSQSIIHDILEEKIANLGVHEKYAFRMRKQILPQIARSLNGRAQALRERFVQERGPFRSVLLVDEFERMHPDNQQRFLGLLDRGVVETNKGETIDCRGTLVIFTSNIGTEDIADLLDKTRKYKIGFEHGPLAQAREMQEINERIYQNVEPKVRKFMLPALYSRIGKEGIVVFRALRREDHARILERELSLFQAQLAQRSATEDLHIALSSACKEFILDKIDNPREGARQDGRLLDKYIRSYLAQAIAGGALEGQAFVLFDVETNGSAPRIVMRRGKLPEALQMYSPIIPAPFVHSIVPPPLSRSSSTDLALIDKMLDDCLEQCLVEACEGIDAADKTHHRMMIEKAVETAQRKFYERQAEKDLKRGLRRESRKKNRKQ